MKDVVALLPIKLNSERVKGKNFRNLCGRPLYQWILETLLSCNNVKKIVVNTDSLELIDNLNKSYPQIKTILRPEFLRGDNVSMNKIIEYDLSVCLDEEFFIQTHTTNPLISGETIDLAIERFFENLNKNDSLFSVNRIQSRTYWGNGKGINHTLGELKRTQDLEPIFEENSNLFIFSRQSFLNSRSRVGTMPILYETPKNESFEIDEEEDFALIEQLVRGK
ncbi:acylneuraminate cytidylyltransferase family protein [Aminipila butyrica]|uniref:Acylneuraminate cytidylyltransferase family protein n=1 Tax=Aminipila butyrica TaxID=433296 RepID=A0A858BSI0_9FIRM|nr:acylneuraminate cytidylyltransferase family protein [Aminipila butyrica]QIB68169.1 acylneuraminate cytidylyltransferase family protein [Aminipila butyrica]